MRRRANQSVHIFLVVSCAMAAVADDKLPVVPVEGQPLAANVRRVVQAMNLLGAPLSADVANQLESAAQDRDHARLQAALDPHALLVVAINPESRVKVLRGRRLSVRNRAPSMLAPRRSACSGSSRPS